MISSYPLGVVNYFIRNPTWRLWYGLITGFVLQYLMYQNDCFHLVAATFLTYLFLVFLGRKISAFWVLGMTVLHLSGLHIHRMIVDWGGWHLDSTTIYMMSICKFSSIAFSYEDGVKADGEFKSSYHKSKYFY
jgi:lysophospholipid acyltransferase